MIQPRKRITPAMPLHTLDARVLGHVRGGDDVTAGAPEPDSRHDTSKNTIGNIR